MSISRYGHISVPFREDDVPNPVDPYGVSKLAAENILKILCQTHNTEYNIAIPHNIIGPKQKYDDPFRNVVSIMTNLMMQNRRPIIYGDGLQKRCFSDASEKHLFCKPSPYIIGRRFCIIRLVIIETTFLNGSSYFCFGPIIL